MEDNTSVTVTVLGVVFSLLIFIIGCVYINNYYTLQENGVIERMVEKGADPILAMCVAHNRLASDQICFARSLTVKGN